MKVQALVLVTDKQVRVIKQFDGDLDPNDYKDAVREEFSWGKAAAAELRVVEFDVPLLSTTQHPEEASAETVRVEVAPDVRRELEAAAQRHRLGQIEEVLDLLSEALTPGLYEFTRTDHSRGFRRVPPKS